MSSRSGAGSTAAHEEHEVRDEHAVGVEIGRRVLSRPDDEDPSVDGYGRNRRTAAVEDRELRGTLLDQLGAPVHVRREYLACQSSTGAATADGRNAGEGGGLEVVGGSVAAGPGDLQERLDGRSDLDDLGLGRAPSPHGDDDHVQALGEEPRQVARDRRFADALAGPDHGERRHAAEPLVLRRLEAEVRPHVSQPVCESAACPQHPLTRAEHRLVREVDDDLDLGRDLVERLEHRQAVLLPTAELLSATDEDRSHEVERQLGQRVSDNVDVVLAVDERNRFHRVVTSSSIRAVYFSNASVSVEN